MHNSKESTKTKNSCILPTLDFMLYFLHQVQNFLLSFFITLTCVLTYRAHKIRVPTYGFLPIPIPYQGLPIHIIHTEEG